MAVQHVVVVPKPLEALPALPHPDADDPESQAIARRLRLARAEHAETLATVREALAAQHPEALWLETPSAAALDAADLVISVGGDGTFLTAARFAQRTPLLGVNSSPSTSTGHFCAAVAGTFGAVLGAVLEGALAPTALLRIRAEVEGKALPHDALNDMLFANRTPVSSTRYAIRVGAVTELHLSSGIWIATSSGSTAAIRSAGGAVRPIEDKRLQWVVREPYRADHEVRTLLRGFTDAGLEIVSRSDKNALFVDGHGEPFAVPFGCRARIYPAPEALMAYLGPPR